MFPTVLSAGSEQGPYRIESSLRFRSSASAYLRRTYTSNATWTFSVWIKRGSLGSIKPILGSLIKFNANDTLTAVGLTTTAVYRDPSAWYHLVVSNSGCYVNGVSIGSVTTSAITDASICFDGTNYFDGYLADINFIDGQALTPSSFGEIDATTGVWKPKQYSGTYGTNGFKLNFSNGTSTTTLGYDSSGNSNNWTTNNISLTAGSTYDWMIDSPTKYQGSSYGVGDYAVLNPLDNGGLTVTNGNLTSSDSTGNYVSIRATIGISSGKWYWEFTQISGGASIFCGIAKASATLTSGDYIGSNANGWGYLGLNGNKYTSGSAAGYGAPYTTGDVIGIAFDANAGTLTYYKNNVSQGTAFTGLTLGPYFAALSNNSNSSAINFGQRPFAFSLPSGYKSLCTQNLPAGVVTMSGTFTGNLLANGPFVYLNGVPEALTINGNAVTWGTHADKFSNGFKVRSTDSRYNNAGPNTYTVTTAGPVFKDANAQVNP